MKIIHFRRRTAALLFNSALASMVCAFTGISKAGEINYSAQDYPMVIDPAKLTFNRGVTYPGVDNSRLTLNRSSVELKGPFLFLNSLVAKGSNYFRFFNDVHTDPQLYLQDFTMGAEASFAFQGGILFTQRISSLGRFTVKSGGYLVAYTGSIRRIEAEKDSLCSLGTPDEGSLLSIGCLQVSGGADAGLTHTCTRSATICRNGLMTLGSECEFNNLHVGGTLGLTLDSPVLVNCLSVGNRGTIKLYTPYDAFGTYTPEAGSVYTLIARAGKTRFPHFHGVDEGQAMVALGTIPTLVMISYQGGDGNDLTATVMPL